MVEFYLCCILKQPLIRLEGHIYLQGRYTFLQGIYLQDDSHLANKTQNRMKIGNGILAEKKKNNFLVYTLKNITFIYVLILSP